MPSPTDYCCPACRRVLHDVSGVTDNLGETILIEEGDVGICGHCGCVYLYVKTTKIATPDDIASLAPSVRKEVEHLALMMSPPGIPCKDSP